MTMSVKRKKVSPFEEVEKQFEELESLADDLMASAFSERPSWNTRTCCLQALSNVSVKPNEVIVTADLPNIQPDSLKVEAVDQNLIEIKAKLKKKMRFTDFGIYHRQGEFEFLRCQDRVQVAIDIEKMRISCEQGFLEVRIPRIVLQKIE